VDGSASLLAGVRERAEYDRSGAPLLIYCRVKHDRGDPAFSLQSNRVEYDCNVPLFLCRRVEYDRGAVSLPRSLAVFVVTTVKGLSTELCRPLLRWHAPSSVSAEEV